MNTKREVPSPLGFRLEGIGKVSVDSRNMEGYRVIEIGDRRYGVSLEIPHDSPLSKSEIKEASLYLRVDNVGVLKKVPSEAVSQTEQGSHRQSRARSWARAEGILGIAAIVACAAFAHDRIRTDALVEKLGPFVEHVDGLPGISLRDRLDFVQRAGLSEEQKSAFNSFGYNFDLQDFPHKNLERALQSYQTGNR